ncbi:MAG: cobyric acid synthase [Hyphomicrobiaceae bacterium]
MRAPAVMIQGAGSNVGKSIVVAGLCRVFARRGVSVRPFKPQNMSNNAAAVKGGGEIGRAQALQARAAGVEASVHFNPVLLKPESETGSQVIVQGRRHRTMRAREFGLHKRELLPAVMESFNHVASDADLVIVEGAGSPAEINLRNDDIANMGFATAADVPVIVVGDIERGGVIASLVGTHTVLNKSDRSLIKAFLINKFRGDPELFDDGLVAIVARTGWRSLGVLPYVPEALRLPAEDILDLDVQHTRTAEQKDKKIKIAVPQLDRIANFDDLDPLRLEPAVALQLVRPGKPLPLDCDLIILPGSKNTIDDLNKLKAEGWDIDIAAHIRQGGYVLGLCGGYQMLGTLIDDPDGVEGRIGTVAGLGLLNVASVLDAKKVVRPVRGRHLESRAIVTGYEIHLGRTTGPDTERPVFEIDGRPNGAISPDGKCMGTYVHGVFSNDGYRRAFLRHISASKADIGQFTYDAHVEAALDCLAEHIESHIDTEAVYQIACGRC